MWKDRCSWQAVSMLESLVDKCSPLWELLADVKKGLEGR